MRASTAALACVLATAGCGGTQLAWYGHTPDRAHRIDVRQRGDTQWVELDGRRSRSYRYVAADEMAFDASGRRVAFAAEVGDRPERWVVVTDFVEGRTWDGVAGLRFGPAGRHFVHAGLEHGAWRMVLDGAAGPAFPTVDVDSSTFSPDGRRFGYVAGDGRCARVVVDGRAGACAAHVVGLALADEPAHDVVVTSGGDDGSDAHVEVGGVAVADLPRVRELAVDASVRHWAVVDGAPGRWSVVADGRRQEAFDDVGRIAWGPAGTLAYAGRRDGAWRMVVDGRAGPPFEQIEEPVFAANGTRFGYIGRDDGRSVVTIDGRVAWESPTVATALVFSDDGAHVAWVYRDGPTAVLAVDDHRYGFDVAVERTLRFTHDGKHWAALVGSLAQRRLFVVVDGRERLPFDSEELFGSPSGDLPARLGTWVSAELDRYVARTGS